MSMLAEIRCPVVLAVPNQNHRSTDAQNQLIHCSVVGSHKFKPKSQYKLLPNQRYTPYGMRTHKTLPVPLTSTDRFRRPLIPGV